MADLILGAIAPQDAFEQFAARKQLRPTFRWQDVWQAEHARAFMVAGVARLDILSLIYDELEAALASGADMGAFSDALRTKLVAKGFWGDIEVTDATTGEVRKTRFNDARLRLIFDTNMRQSHAAGRWQRGMRGRMPFIRYITMRDERVRVSHKAWDGLVLPREHPFWDTHLPPNDFRCRCHFEFIDQVGVDRLQAAGQPVKTKAPDVQTVAWRNTATGEVEQVPAGIGPGFAYNPGKAHVQRAAQLQNQALNRLATLRETSTPRGGAASDSGYRLTRAVIHRTRREAGFAQFLANPPLALAGQAAIGMPVAAVPSAGGAPTVAAVSAADLAAQSSSDAYPLALPTTTAGWAMAQTVIDNGAKLTVASSPEQVLWYWARGDRVETLLLQRDALVWWVKSQVRLTRAEAIEKFPRLESVL